MGLNSSATTSTAVKVLEETANRSEKEANREFMADSDSLRVKSFGNGLVAVKNVRGYGQDRTRGEESVQRGLTELRDAVR